jgi:hypothetical protein
MRGTKSVAITTRTFLSQWLQTPLPPTPPDQTLQAHKTKENLLNGRKKTQPFLNDTPSIPKNVILEPKNISNKK